mmetsp:Transcript_19027/g.57494  ORF Transcript_19027/g.57494 Transcript_19027/m.57494 type:complete len:290 (+) Transcript_19027:58-927(+)
MAKELSVIKSFGGYWRRYEHASSELGCDMKFHVFIPPATDGTKFPVLYFLSGLTCTDENFVQKAGGHRRAADLGIALVVPDTSPRGLGVEGEDDKMHIGTAAGFYLDATQSKWSKYRMYSYVTKELPQLLKDDKAFAALDTTNTSIFGHSMGGHGALTIGLMNPDTYKSISAFAPMCDCSAGPLGSEAMAAYLGEDNKESWKQYDACEVAATYSGPKLPHILIDQGDDDDFWKNGNLNGDKFEKAAQQSGKLSVKLRMQSGYGHSYFFISTFVADHIEHHAKHLKPGSL